MKITNRKQENFRRLAEARTNKVRDVIRILGNLSDKRTYEYTEQEAQQIMEDVRASFDRLNKKFFPDEEPAELPFSFISSIQRERIVEDENGNKQREVTVTDYLNVTDMNTEEETQPE